MIKLFFFLKSLCIKFEKTPLLSSIFKFCYRILNLLYGASIGYKAKFENIPTLPHNISGIFISELAIIGKNCTIFHQVTIGSVNKSGQRFAPKIGDDVFIGAGAIIIGDIQIGNNVNIGAGAIVHQNVPDKSTVVMSGMKIITK